MDTSVPLFYHISHWFIRSRTIFFRYLVYLLIIKEPEGQDGDEKAHEPAHDDFLNGMDL